MSQGFCFNLGSQRHQRVPRPNLLHKSWYLGFGLGNSSNATMQAIKLEVQRLTVVADIRRHSWGTHWYPFQATKTNFWILWEQIMRQNQTNPRCITNLPNALSIAVVSPLKNYATLLLFQQLNADILKMMCKYLMYMQWTANTCNLSKQQCLNLTYDSIQSGVKHYFTNSTYVNKHVLYWTCYFQQHEHVTATMPGSPSRHQHLRFEGYFFLLANSVHLLMASSGRIFLGECNSLQDIFSPRSTVTNTQFSEGNGFEAFEFLLEFSIQLQASLPHIQ